MTNNNFFHLFDIKNSEDVSCEITKLIDSVLTNYHDFNADNIAKDIQSLLDYAEQLLHISDISNELNDCYHNHIDNIILSFESIYNALHKNKKFQESAHYSRIENLLRKQSVYEKNFEKFLYNIERDNYIKVPIHALTASPPKTFKKTRQYVHVNLEAENVLEICQYLTPDYQDHIITQLQTRGSNYDNKKIGQKLKNLIFDDMQKRTTFFTKDTICQFLQQKQYHGPIFPSMTTWMLDTFQKQQEFLDANTNVEHYKNLSDVLNHLHDLIEKTFDITIEMHTISKDVLGFQFYKKGRQYQWIIQPCTAEISCMPIVNNSDHSVAALQLNLSMDHLCQFENVMHIWHEYGHLLHFWGGFAHNDCFDNIPADLTEMPSFYLENCCLNYDYMKSLWKIPEKDFQTMVEYYNIGDDVNTCLMQKESLFAYYFYSTHHLDEITIWNNIWKESQCIQTLPCYMLYHPNLYDTEYGMHLYSYSIGKYLAKKYQHISLSTFFREYIWIDFENNTHEHISVDI